MQVQNISSYNVSSKGFYLGDTVKAMQKNFNRPAKFKINTKSVQDVLRKFDVHRKENVDLIIHFSEEEGFYAYISSKKSGIPNSENNKHILSKDPEIIKQIIEWVDSWDRFFAKKEMV